MILMSLNLTSLKEVLGFKLLATPIRYVLAQLEPLPIMLPLVNIDCASSPEWISRVHALTIQSKQEDTFFMNAKDLMGIGTQEEIR